MDNSGLKDALMQRMTQYGSGGPAINNSNGLQDPYKYRMPDGSNVPFIPFVNPYPKGTGYDRSPMPPPGLNGGIMPNMPQGGYSQSPPVMGGVHPGWESAPGPSDKNQGKPPQQAHRQGGPIDSFFNKGY